MTPNRIQADTVAGTFVQPVPMPGRSWHRVERGEPVCGADVRTRSAEVITTGVMLASKVCADCLEGMTIDECEATRERSVAGVSDDIPDCPIHGPYRQPVDLLPDGAVGDLVRVAGWQYVISADGSLEALDSRDPRYVPSPDEVVR